MSIFTGAVVAAMSSLHPPTAAELQTITDALHGVTDTWTTWSPVCSATGGGFAIGNGSISGVYWQAGKQFYGLITMTIGSTTTLGSGFWNFTMPPGITLASGMFWEQLGGVSIRDLSAGTTYGLGCMSASATALTGATGTGTRLGPAVPFAFASGDQISASLEGQTA